MQRSAREQEREGQWRERLARQTRSGQSVAAFCRSEGIAAPTFYWWRSRLGKGESPAVAVVRRQRPAASFIDLGALAAAPTGDSGGRLDAGLTIRLELPGGIVLVIARP